MVYNPSMLGVGIDNQLTREQETFTGISSSGSFYKIPTKEAVRMMSTPTEEDFFSSEVDDIERQITKLTHKVSQIVAVKISLLGELYSAQNPFKQLLKKCRVQHIVLSPSLFCDDLTFDEILAVVDPRLTTVILTRPVFDKIFDEKNLSDTHLLQRVSKIKSRYKLRGILVETITDISMKALVCVEPKSAYWEKLPSHLASTHRIKGEGLLATRIAAFLATGERTVLEALKLAKVHQSGILQSMPLSITDMIWNHVSPRYEVLKRHKIVRGITTGKINDGLFEFFREIDGFALSNSRKLTLTCSMGYDSKEMSAKNIKQLENTLSDGFG